MNIAQADEPAMQRIRHAMREQVLRHAVSPCAETAIPRLTLSRLPEPNRGIPTVLAPVTCLILQGAKRVAIGDADLQYGSASYFVASLDLPATGQVLVASPDQPYLAVGLRLDGVVLAELIAAMPNQLIGQMGHESGNRDKPAFAISAVTPDLLEAWAGLLALLDRPDDITTLAPAREREILYRLLRGPLGHQLCQMALDDKRLARIRRAIEWIRAHYSETLPTALLAELAGMSVASFHRHFRAATAMSPLQYQKSLRLHAARRLLAAGMEASRAAYSVGYESPSQFSREYSRSFRVPPSRDAQRLRG